MFRRVLIANRGEIAVRIIRACRDLGITSVATYSEPDRTSLHVRLADEACLLGPAPAGESYLDMQKILDAAERSRVDAIHPGYGFLSENPHFAAACAQAGIPMIGPSAKSMRLIADKTGARTLLRQHEVSLIPGTFGILSSVEEAMDEGRALGYPVMIKASNGLGGKGIRFVADESRMRACYAAAGSEALHSFGDSSLYLEKYLERPRHIDIQILADRHGNAIHLGDRKCSIQRRRQKVLEECPSPFVDEELRAKMGESAIRVVRAAQYENAGAVEFLVDRDRNFYFLGMTMRLSAEHTVTEAVTGVDLVCEQFRIAAGEPLSLRRDQVRMNGWALECRICAEDPEHSLFPSPGVIQRLQEPSGPGVRLDSGIYQGWEVSIDYDSLLAKLVASGADRAQAIARMTRAYQEYGISGIETNLPLFFDILSDPDFLAGNTHTDFIADMQKKNKDSATQHPPAVFRPHALAIALAYADSTQADARHRVAKTESSWKLSGRPGFSGLSRR